MITCHVKVAGRTYTGLYRSTASAVIDALQRFPEARGATARAAA